MQRLSDAWRSVCGRYLAAGGYIHRLILKYGFSYQSAAVRWSPSAKVCGSDVKLKASKSLNSYCNSSIIYQGRKLEIFDAFRFRMNYKTKK